jgi:hypothetical protein
MAVSMVQPVLSSVPVSVQVRWSIFDLLRPWRLWTPAASREHLAVYRFLFQR